MFINQENIEKQKEARMEYKSDFIIKFRGTRGSFPVAKANFLEFGGNTACVEVHCGKQLIILQVLRVF